MTVQEIITFLEQYDPSMPVLVTNGEQEFGVLQHVTDVEYSLLPQTVQEKVMLCYPDYCKAHPGWRDLATLTFKKCKDI